MIIDAHCHAGRGNLLDAPWQSAPLGAYLRRAARAGIARTLVFAPFADDTAAANRDVARIVARLPDRLTGVAWINPRRDGGQIAELVAEAVLKHGFRGIKVHRAEHGLTREVLVAARRFRVPIIYDPASQPASLDLAAAEYPDVPVIVAHLGSFADDWRTHQQVCDQAVRHPNIYADSSGVRRFDYLVQFVSRAGPHKLLFGSDGPWLHPAVELSKIRCIGLGQADQSAVLGGNAERLFGRRATSTPTPTAEAR